MDNLPSILKTVQTVAELQLSPLDGLAHLRACQLLQDFDLDPGTDLYAAVRSVVELAYRLGLRDGVVRVGELAG